MNGFQAKTVKQPAITNAHEISIQFFGKKKLETDRQISHFFICLKKN